MELRGRGAPVRRALVVALSTTATKIVHDDPITGSTGTIGSAIIEQLAGEDADVRALVRGGKTPSLPAGVRTVTGDMTDLPSMRAALDGVDTLFLLNAVVPDELTQALITLDLAIDAGIQRLVYFSVFNADVFTDVPHFTAKYAVERAIAARSIPATILRPAYFFQNDAALKQTILDHGVYPMPVGSTGVAMVDARDIAAVAAHELLRRDRATTPLPRTTIDVSGPDLMTGGELATIWSEATRRSVTYAGDDLDVLEGVIAPMTSAVFAGDMRLMYRAIQQRGMVPSQDAHAILAGMLGRPQRRYVDFARETASAWGVLIRPPIEEYRSWPTPISRTTR